MQVCCGGRVVCKTTLWIERIGVATSWWRGLPFLFLLSFHGVGLTADADTWEAYRECRECGEVLDLVAGTSRCAMAAKHGESGDLS